MINRRDVVRAGTLGALVTGMLGAQAAPAAASPTGEAERVGPRDWKRLAGALSSSSTLYRPRGDRYPPPAVPFNHRYAGIHPGGIVACGTTADVRTAVRRARSVGLPAAPRSGLGHNHAGYSTTTGQGEAGVRPDRLLPLSAGDRHLTPAGRVAALAPGASLLSRTAWIPAGSAGRNRGASGRSRWRSWW